MRQRRGDASMEEQVVGRSLGLRHRALALLCLAAVLLWAAAGSASSTAVSFAVVGDVHLALHSENDGMKMLADSERILQLVIETLNKIPGLDFVVFNGDLVDVPTAENVQRFAEMAGRLRMPYYATLGNHDVPHASPQESGHLPQLSKEELVRTFLGKGFEEGRSWWSAAPRPGFHIVGLDSSVPGRWGGHVQADALRWLESDLAEHREELTIIFLHHSLVNFWEAMPLEEGFFVGNRDEVRQLCERHPGVQCIVSSHFHLAGGRLDRGIRYFTTPSVISYPCGFALFTVTPASVEMARVQVPDSGLVDDARGLLASDALWRGFFPPGAGGEREMKEFFERGGLIRFPLAPW